jgi:hypothetical protein
LADIKGQVVKGKSLDHFPSNTDLLLLNQQFYHENLAHLLSLWCCLWLRDCEDIRPDIIASGGFEPWKTAAISYMHSSGGDFNEAVAFLAERTSPRSRQLLNLAKDWIRIFLPHVLSKIHRVSFGLLLPTDEERWVNEALDSCSGDKELARKSVVVSKSRRLLSVPFEGKDAPSRSAEFAHPDVLIGLSILSYRLHGLRLRDLRDLLQELKIKLTQVRAFSRRVFVLHFSFFSRNLVPWPFATLGSCSMNGAVNVLMEGLVFFHLSFCSRGLCRISKCNNCSDP